MKWVLCDQGNFRPQSFIDRTCQPTVEPETSLGVQASKPVHQCLFSRIAWQRKRATDHFLNRFGKAEAESKSHLSRKRTSKTFQNILKFLVFCPPYLQDAPHPHLGSTTSTRRLRWWPMRQAHRKVRKHRTVAATFGHGTATGGPPVAPPGGGRLLAIFFSAEFAESSDENFLMSAVLANECSFEGVHLQSEAVQVGYQLTKKILRTDMEGATNQLQLFAMWNYWKNPWGSNPCPMQHAPTSLHSEPSLKVWSRPHTFCSPTSLGCPRTLKFWGK